MPSKWNMYNAGSPFCVVLRHALFDVMPHDSQILYLRSFSLSGPMSHNNGKIVNVLTFDIYTMKVYRD